MDKLIKYANTETYTDQGPRPVTTLRTLTATTIVDTQERNGQENGSIATHPPPSKKEMSDDREEAPNQVVSLVRNLI